MNLLIHCNAGFEFGMGHLMRSLAVAEEALFRKWRVRLVGDLSERAIESAKIVVPHLEVMHVHKADIKAYLLNQVGQGFFDVIHIDSYWLGTSDFRRPGVIISNMQDAHFGARPADLAIDANIGAENQFDSSYPSRTRLLGKQSVLIRQQVRTRRRITPRAAGPPRVLVALGGTDLLGLTPKVAQALADLRVHLEATLVCRDELQDEVSAYFVDRVPLANVVSFLSDLPAVAVDQDLVICAAGTSIWDFAYLGIPVGLVCLVENQKAGYTAAVEANLAIPLGTYGQDDIQSNVRSLEPALSKPSYSGGYFPIVESGIDGRGASRLVNAWGMLLME